MLWSDDDRLVAIEDHRVLDCNSKAKGERHAQLDELAKRHTKFEFLSSGTQKLGLQRNPTDLVLDSTVELLSLWKEEDLEDLQEALDLSLQVNYSAEV